MNKTIIVSASVSGLLAVALGAFGAHTLRTVVSADSILIWEKGIQYQFYHTLVLLFCALYLQQQQSVRVRSAALFFMLGIFCFSGSLYLLATRELTQISTALIGPVTPLGGMFFIVGWALLLFHFLRNGSAEKNMKE